MANITRARKTREFVPPSVESVRKDKGCETGESMKEKKDRWGINRWQWEGEREREREDEGGKVEEDHPVSLSVATN